MKRLILCWVILLVQALTGWQVSGAGLIVVDHWPPSIPEPPRHPWPPLPPPHWRPRPEPYHFAPLEVTSISAKADINDQIASTTIEQEFYNPNSTRLEGTFICPLPKGANISKFSMEIDGRPTQAELLPADKASSIYEEIVRKVKDPALLEYAGRDMVKVRIFPIEPRSKRKIVLRYAQLLTKDAGMISYALPMSTEKYSHSAVSNVVVTVELKSTQPIKSLYSPSHEIEVKRRGTRSATASYESTGKSAPEDFVLYFAPEPDEIGLNVLATREEGEEGYFLLLASPGVSARERDVVARDIAFVIDTSGSMAGKKLEQAKKALEFCVENLGEKDRFQVIRFSTDVEALFDGLKPASRANTEKAVTFARDLKPMGGTAIDDALKAALELRNAKDAGDERRLSDRPFVVIFLTDGRPTIGETGEDAIVKNVKKANAARDRVFCFGIGTDVNTHLLDKITEQTRAFSQYVLPEEDLELKVSSFYSKIKEPVLANPRLKTSGSVRITQVYPSEMPDLFNGEQAVLVGRYKGGGDAVFTIEGTVNGRKETFTYEASLPASSGKYEFLPRLWATRRVGYLLDEIRLRGENSELRDEVTQLARKYGIVTPYTSYLIVEDEVRRNVPREVRSLQRLEEDAPARRAGAESWDALQSDRSGLSATANARESYAYKSANAPAPAASGGAMESFRALGVPSGSMSRGSGIGGGGASVAGVPGPGQSAPVDDGRMRLAQYSQQAQFVAGRTFFLNNGQWMDQNVQNQQNARRVLNVQFGSKEYFDLIRTNAAARPLLAVGRNVQFVLGDTIYQVTE